MNRIFVFLYEPASYTVDRNLKVYVPIGVDYCYLHGDSEAKNTTEGECNRDNLERMSRWKQWRYMLRVLKKYDKIIYNGYSDLGFIMLFILNLWYRKPIGIDSDTQYREPTNLVIRWIKHIYLNVVFGNKNIYGLAGGNYAHKDLFRKFGMKEDRVRLMPMMVDNVHFDNPDFRKKKMVPLRFVYVGRLIECKNIEFMIHAFLKYRAECMESELHIVGRGLLEDELKSRYAVCDGVCFDGPKYGDELLDVYRKNHVLILPSTYEPWGLVVNEAMSAGMPVLVSNEVGAHYDLVDGNDTGFVFDAYNEQSLVDVMKQISNIDTYKKYSDNAYGFIHNYWNYSLYRKCLEDFINETTQ
ncbi:glycosyltransferase family 4 protein [Bacteroides congonensis]|uniref:glycosyltransferase family 4 protein n=1 Tax=Bacteroides congonensis TaxID=1871006 RepID=UPI001896DFEF|nr:glycosyltransferase family 4 protein [Bacteroides congonensis]